MNKVIQNCEVDSLVLIANTAAQFMEEVTLSSVVCQSQHAYKQSDQLKSMVQLAGAAFLDVVFDPR